MINVIKISKDPHPAKFKGKLNAFALHIDQIKISNWIENAAKAQGFSWQESANSIVCLEELHKSIENSGEFLILVGSHCLMNEVKDPMDINLSPVEVKIGDDTVEWRLKIMNLGSPSAELSFQFHKPQLVRAVQDLPHETVIN